MAETVVVLHPSSQKTCNFCCLLYKIVGHLCARVCLVLVPPSHGVDDRADLGRWEALDVIQGILYDLARLPVRILGFAADHELVQDVHGLLIHDRLGACEACTATTAETALCDVDKA